MDFKHINDKTEKHMTPKSEVSIFSKRISAISTESPFRNLPNFSTPPSRFAKILNPFESHLIERLHLPTFSPNVFAQNSTPKTEQKFKWTIEDISSLKPADIDETTISQHVFTTEDPQVESLVQQKIETFFSEKEIVPSPMNVKVNNVPLVQDCSILEETPSKSSIKQVNNGSTQTVLTLPPVLPKELEEALKPYFKYDSDSDDYEQSEENMKNSSLYRQLFEYDENQESSHNSPDDVHSILSSPALSTGFSPIQLSPCNKGLGSPLEMPELKDCTLSPISKNSSESRTSRISACRLNMSEQMSVDASLIVPDLENQQFSRKTSYESDKSLSPIRPVELAAIETVNWSMEYKQVSLGSSSSLDSDKMDVSNSNTPHSKIFSVGQRKRLSESFKREDSDDKENVLELEDVFMQNRSKIFRNDATDAGYHTQEADFSCYTNVYASTPSKRSSANIEL